MAPHHYLDSTVLYVLIAHVIAIPTAMAGEWIVETHSLIVRAPPAIAGVEDAAIGDVSQNAP